MIFRVIDFDSAFRQLALPTSSGFDFLLHFSAALVVPYRFFREIVSQRLGGMLPAGTSSRWGYSRRQTYTIGLMLTV